MRIDLADIEHSFRTAQAGKKSLHAADARLHPSRLQYDYLTLVTLARDIQQLIAMVGPAEERALAIDLGAHHSPYRSLVEAQGFELKTMDLTRDDGADYAGTVEDTSLPDAPFDLVLCTQVLEHCDNPWRAMAEIRRILKPGGHAIFSAPHVWFFHPHPHDHWRFTQEGMVRLCEAGGLTPVCLLAQGGTVLTVAQMGNVLAYGVLGRLGAPMYALVNWIAPIVDKLAPNALLCHNFACLARRV